ncbi:MAG TPA: hypothetical protein DDZ66_09340 [Firmicutes bacterium]|nr:hypothetical protein [Bacillota bacterium]
MAYADDCSGFARLKLVRFLLSLVSIFILAHFLGSMAARIVGGDCAGPFARYAIFHLLGFRYVGKVLHRSQVSPRSLLGPIPAEFSLKKMVGLLWGSLTVNLGLAYLTVVMWMTFFGPQLLEILGGFEATSIMTAVVQFVGVVLLAPIFEEFVFRGIILGYALQRWNDKTAIILSALLFALGHAPNLLGPLVGGLILSLLYVRTRTLVAPMLVHMANNLFGFLMGIGDIFDSTTASLLLETTDRTHLVIVGITLLTVGLWPLIYFVKDSLKPKSIDLEG